MAYNVSRMLKFYILIKSNARHQGLLKVAQAQYALTKAPRTTHENN